RSTEIRGANGCRAGRHSRDRRPGIRKREALMAYQYRHEKETLILSKYFGDPAARTVQGWRERGGWKALEKALTMSAEESVQLVKDSGLRGRGGAGFPTGVKWSFFKDDGKPHSLLINADESEPGAFKDRELCRWTPQQMI